MKCGRVRSLMGAYLYGDLEPSQMMEIRLHAQGCHECASDLAERGQALSMLDGAVPELTDEEREQITWSVKGAVRTVPERRGAAARWAAAFAVAAALCVGIGIGAVIGSRLDNWHRSTEPRAAVPRVEITEDLSPSPEAAKDEDKQPAVRVPKSEEPPDRVPSGGPSHKPRPRLKIDPSDLLPTAVSNATPTNRSRADSYRLMPVPDKEQPGEESDSAVDGTGETDDSDGSDHALTPQTSVEPGSPARPTHDDTPVDGAIR